MPKRGSGRLRELRDELLSLATEPFARHLQKVAWQQQQVGSLLGDAREDLAFVVADLLTLQVAEHDDLDPLLDARSPNLVTSDLEVEGLDLGSRSSRRLRQ